MERRSSSSIRRRRRLASTLFSRTQEHYPAGISLAIPTSVQISKDPRDRLECGVPFDRLNLNRGTHVEKVDSDWMRAGHCDSLVQFGSRTSFGLIRGKAPESLPFPER